MKYISETATKSIFTQSVEPAFGRGFTLAEVFSPHPNGQRKAAFTLAEVLITLGIIGVVAALTLPPLINKFRVKQLEVAFKKSSSMIEQALQKTAQEYGYGSIKDLTTICGFPVYSDSKGTMDEENPNTIKYRACSTKYKNEIIPEMSDFFVSNFKQVYKYSGGSNWCYFNKELLAIKLRTYGTGEIFQSGSGYCNMQAIHNTGLHILADGTAITSFDFLYFGQYDGLSLSFDTNGPKKGPNRYGYDIFVYNTGNWNSHRCTAKGSDPYGYNSRACYNYALKDVNPDDSTKGYWESLKL